MQASHTASRCMQKIHQPQVVRREEHVGGAHPKKNKKVKNPKRFGTSLGGPRPHALLYIQPVVDEFFAYNVRLYAMPAYNLNAFFYNLS